MIKGKSNLFCSRKLGYLLPFIALQAILLIISCRPHREIRYVASHNQENLYLLYSSDGGSETILDSIYQRSDIDKFLWAEDFTVAYSVKDSRIADARQAPMYILYNYSLQQADTLLHHNLWAIGNFDIYTDAKVFAAARTDSLFSVYSSNAANFAKIGEILIKEDITIEASSLSPDAGYFIFYGLTYKVGEIPEQKSLLASLNTGKYIDLIPCGNIICNLGIWDSDTSFYFGNQDDELYRYFLTGKCEKTELQMGSNLRLMGNRYLLMITYDSNDKIYNLMAYDIQQDYNAIRIDSGWIIDYTIGYKNNEVIYIKEENEEFTIYAYDIDTGQYESIVRSENVLFAPIAVP